MAELEQLVEKMEDGDLTLDQSLQAFERGVALTRLCQTELKNAELKVQQLNEDGELADLSLMIQTMHSLENLRERIEAKPRFIARTVAHSATHARRNAPRRLRWRQAHAPTFCLCKL